MRRNIKHFNLCCVFLFLFSAVIYAQQRTITGTVKDKKGETLIGVSVSIKGSKNATVTDIDGKYFLSVPEKENLLTFSYLGMRTLESQIRGSILDVVMEDDYSNLDEVVVVGYGTAKRGELTSSISSVDEKVLANSPVSSSLEAITGRMPGVNVLKTEGSPDAEIQIRVRGGGSITQDNSPLFIVDGFPVNTISDISPRDIQSIDVLKDAASTAIYGAEGANGVIIVTTKKGKAGKVSVNFNASVGLSNVYNLYSVLSPYEYVYMQKELDPGASISGTRFYSVYGLWEDVDIYKSKKGNDWQKQVFGNTGVRQNYNVTATGGTDKTSYMLSLTHEDQSYIMDNSDFKRDNVNFRMNSILNENISFDFTVRLANTVINGPSVSGGKKLRQSVKYAPTRGISELTAEDLLESGETIETIGDLKNPVNDTNDEYKKQNNFTNTYNAGLTWKAFDWLSFRTQGSYEFINSYTDNIWVRGAGESKNNGGYPLARRTDDKGNAWSLQNTLTFNKSFNKIHRLTVIAGQEMKSSQSKRMIAESKFFPMGMSAEDVLANWDKGKPQPTYTTEYEPVRTFSYFGRINYSLNNKYIFTANARYDGKNSFAPEHRWGFFPGISAAWRMLDESFMEKTKEWMSNLKLRLSYGEAGNARVSTDSWKLVYSTVSKQNSMYYPNEESESALRPGNTLNNERLKWESKVSTNFGVDFGFLNERFRGSIDIYNEKTKNLILSTRIPIHTGFNYQLQNVGQTSNKGIEIELNGVLVDTKDFTLEAGFNIAFNKNKVDKYVSEDANYSYISTGSTGSDVDYLVKEGDEVGLMWGFVTDGMYSFDDFNWDQNAKVWTLKVDENGKNIAPNFNNYASLGNNFGPGALKVRDLDGNGIIDANDRTVIGRAQPIHTGGFNINARYKSFDLQAFFNWSYGNDIYNANKIDYTSFANSRKYQNLTTEMSLANRFTTIDPETGYNIYYGEYANPELLKQLNQGKTMWHPMFSTTLLHSWAIEDGSFLRLNTLTIGYTLPTIIARKFKMQNCRFYATGYNLYTWTNYSGQDPEVSTSSKSPLTPGVDNSAYPKARQFVFGANITF